MPTRMPLADLLADATPAYGDSWCGAVAYLTTSATESVTVERLRRDYRRDGAFREPVRLRADGTVANGMHRLAVLITEHATSVAVATEAADGHDGAWVTITHRPIRIVSPEPGEEAADLDPRDHLIDVLRSFPLDEDTWTETIGTSVCDGVHEDTYLLPGPDHVPALLERLAAEAARPGWTLDVLTVTARTTPEFDAWIAAG